MKLFPTACACAALSFTCQPPPAIAASTVQPIGAMAVPGTSAANPFKSFDQITVDPFLQLGALASRSSKSVTLFNAFTNQPIGQTAPVFAGVGADVDNSGPDGVVIAGLRLWGTDYPSLVRVFDLLPNPTSPRQVAVIDTGGTSRADSIDYDPFTQRVAVANGDTSPAFITLISTKTLKITNRIVFDGTNGTPDAVAQGIGTVLYDYALGSFLATVTQLGPDPTKGAIAVMDAHDGHVTRLITGIDGCEPSTLAEGPGDDVIVACDPGFPAPDPVAFAPRTYVVNVRTGAILANITQVGGEDFVAYDLIHQRYYTASRDYFTDPNATAPTPVLGVIDASTNRWIENVPTGPNAHSVATNLLTGAIYLPLASPNPLCDGLPGCIAVFKSVSAGQ